MQNYIPLDSFIETSKLEECHLEICYGLSKSEVNLASRPIPHYEAENQIEKLIPYKLREGDRVSEILNEHRSLLNKEELIYYKSLSHEQKKRFLLFYKQSYCEGEYVRIRYPQKNYYSEPEAIFQERKCDWHTNHKFFPKTLAFIKSLPFTEIGRILFFVSYHHLPSDVHFDRENTCYNGKNHYLWFNPFNSKKFFMLEESGEKDYIDSKCAIFNGRKLHGSEPGPHHSYTLRIDGQLSEEFCNLAKLDWVKR